MRKLFLALWFWLFCWPAFAGVTCALPFTFTNGTVADATQVMANYNALVTCFANNTAASGANSDITSLLGLSTPLNANSGGTTLYLGGTSTGSANAQVVASPSPIGFTLAQKSTLIFIAGFTNTAATTLNANSTGATNVFRRSFSGPVALTGGEIHVGDLVTVTYNGTQYELINDLPAFGLATNLVAGATTDLGTIASHNVTITGNTGITAFGSTATVDFPFYLLRFTGTPQITYNAASLIIPGTTTITAAANDTALAQYLGGGNWQIVSYTRASGQTLVAANANMDIQVFTATGANTWTARTNPPISYVRVFICGAGGGGGGGGRQAAATIAVSGGGGGGGYCQDVTYTAANAGGSQTVTIGTGGLSGAGSTVNGSAGIVGGVGGNSTFGGLLTAFGGGGGGPGQGNGNPGGGGGGGGPTAAGGAGGLNTGGTNETETAGNGSHCAGGAGANTPTTNTCAGTGGGGGVGSLNGSAAGSPGATSTNAAPGGGAGGGTSAANAGQAGGAGGQSIGCKTAPLGGALGNNNGNSAAADFNYHPGCGGGGGGGANGAGTSGGSGGSGTSGGGGGGGGSGDNANAGSGGVGGNGLAFIVSW